jgi:adenine/guanine phosphoribosyltransferase-like PRPP-binding protein
MSAVTSLPDFWQDFLRADAPVLTAPSYRDGYPARLADGRHLLLPIRVLPGDGNRAVASLIINQASFRVLDAIADVLTAQVTQFRADVVIGVPTLGLPLAEGVARRLGHPRMVALSTSRKFWYDEGLSEPLSSITSPQQSKRVYLDPRSLTQLAGRRILLVDDVLSTGTSLSAVLRLLVKAGRPPAAIGVAMTQTQAWRAVLDQIDGRWPAVVRSAMSSPLLIPHQDGGWRPEAGTPVRGSVLRNSVVPVRAGAGRLPLGRGRPGNRHGDCGGRTGRARRGGGPVRAGQTQAGKGPGDRNEGPRLKPGGHFAPVSC